MDIDKIILWCVIGAIVLGVVIYGIIFIIKYAKMTPEERKKVLKTYLKGLIALAEQEIIGSKKGKEKLQMVEDYFNKKAPMAYKVILALLGKDNLKEIIEEALSEVKKTFA